MHHSLPKTSSEISQKSRWLNGSLLRFLLRFHPDNLGNACNSNALQRVAT